MSTSHVTPRMRELLGTSGFLKDKQGGSELRKLYQTQSLYAFDPHKLEGFARDCFSGDVDSVRTALENKTAPDLSRTTTDFEYGFATLVVAGAQRLQKTHPSQEDLPHIETLELLLANGCPPDVPDICRYTALSHACMVPCAKAPALVRTLLIGDANPDHQDVWGVVPLSMAAMATMVEAVDALMEAGADPTIKDADGMTPKELYTGPAVSAVINKWLRRRTGESAPLEDGRACAACKKTGDDGVITRQCSACHTVYYCSRNCQRGHLKEHKPHCKPFSMDNTVILRPNYDSGNTSHVPLASFNPVLSQLGVYMPELRPSAPRARYARPPKTFPKDYVIKVQLPVTAGQPTLPMLVYSKSRNFECRIRREDAPAAYDRVAQLVRTKGFQGAKAYFVAQLRSENELIVKVSEVLADQPF